MTALPVSLHHRILTLLDGVTTASATFELERLLQMTLDEQVTRVFDCLWCLETCWMAVAARRELRANLVRLAELMEQAGFDRCLDEERWLVWSALRGVLDEIRTSL